MIDKHPAPLWNEISQWTLTEAWRAWLGHRPSLTQRLTEYSNTECYVTVTHQDWGQPTKDEKQALDLGDELAWVREVVLYCDKQAMVFARSIFPKYLFDHDQRFHTLGAQGLGTELFKDPAISRGKIEVATINQCHDLFQHCQKTIGKTEESLYARRSLFSVPTPAHCFHKSESPKYSHPHENENSKHCHSHENENSKHGHSREGGNLIPPQQLLVCEVYLPHVSTL